MVSISLPDGWAIRQSFGVQSLRGAGGTNFGRLTLPSHDQFRILGDRTRECLALANRSTGPFGARFTRPVKREPFYASLSSERAVLGKKMRAVCPWKIALDST